MFKKIKNTKKGFTLIELLVVIAIIGVLSSIVLVSLSSSRQKARDGKRVGDIAEIQKALEQYFDVYQSYPSTTPTCTPACTRAGDTDTAIQLLVQQNFFTQQPFSPAGGGNQYYVYKGVLTNNGAECTVAGNKCMSYAVGISLERSDYSVLKNDADQTVGAVFYGPSQNCTAVSDGSAEKCYDQRP